MPPIDTNSIIRNADELDARADALEKECATWIWDRRSEDAEHRDRAVWDNAIAAGRLLCSLHECGAFDDKPRIKNAVSIIQAELAKARRKQEPPFWACVVNVGYPPRTPDTRESYDVYFVKLFEIYCKIAAQSIEDQRAFKQYYVQPQEKAAFHIRMMRGLSGTLREKYRL